MLEDLDLQQRAVVETLDGPLLCLAGPGSGKTRVLTTRAAFMLEQGIPPQNILPLTFSRAAAKSMLQRAAQLTPHAKNIVGGTFHSIGALLLRHLHHVFDLPANFTVLDPGDAEQCVRSCLVELRLPSGRNLPQARTWLKVLSYAANTRLPVGEAVERLAPGHVEMVEHFKELQTAYARFKLSRGLVDYDDLLTLFRLLVRDPRTAPVIRQRFPYVMVDEAQDCNRVQIEIMYRLGGDAPNVMAVGDPAQAIYGFRGADPSAIFDFTRQWPQAKVIPLETNYRSLSPIVEMANAVDRAMTPRFERKLRPARKSAGAPRPLLVVCDDPAHEIEEIAQRLIAAKADGVPLHHQAVLVRSMAYGRQLEAALIAKRIPYRVVGGLRLDEASHIKDVLCLARVADNPRSSPAWLRLLQLAPGVGAKTAHKIAGELETVSDPNAVSSVLEEAELPKGATLGPIIASYRAMLDEARDLPTRLSNGLRALEPLLESRYEADWEARRQDFGSILDAASSFSRLTDFLSAVTLDNSLDQTATVAPTDQADELPVTISTIHASKGLEWSLVHVPSFHGLHLPSVYAEDPKEQAEELRVLYVLLTRAADQIVFYRPSFLGDQRRSPPPPSPFMDIIGSFLTTTTSLTKRPHPSLSLETTAKIDALSALSGN